MPTTTNDNRLYRAMNAEEADQLLQEIAKAECDIAVIVAIADRELADRKSKMTADCAPLLEIIRAQAKILDNYIAANAANFKEPRARKTDFGSYGIRTVGSLVIANPEALIQNLQKRKRNDLIEVKVSLNKKAIEAAIRKGEAIPGATIVNGERRFYKVSEPVIKEAVQHAAKQD